MAKSHSRGHEIYYDGFVWRYTDTNMVLDDNRVCKRCGKSPTKEGEDNCLGHIDGATSCCCGHGIEDTYIK